MERWLEGASHLTTSTWNHWKYGRKGKSSLNLNKGFKQRKNNSSNDALRTVDEVLPLCFDTARQFWHFVTSGEVAEWSKALLC